MVAEEEVISLSGEQAGVFSEPALLLTDIENSTGLLERAPDAYFRALSRHHAILREITDQNGGHEFQESGDGFFLAFPTAASAARASLEMQNALHREAWPAETGQLRVRMALHQEKTDFRDGQYRGSALHTAARLLAAGHGGQVLCSPSVAEALRDCFDLQRLGTFRLRGFEKNLVIFQLGRKETFPPLRVEQARRHNLPPGRDAFIGRGVELASLVELLASRSNHQLVSLIGPGGIGKTRLALKAAHQLLEDYEHSVIYVPLADATHPAAIPEGILVALGARFESDHEAIPQITKLLAGVSTLLVLDNLEQLSADGALMINRLCQALPLVRILATSRLPIGAPGEREFPVAPLSLPSNDNLAENDSVVLFLARASRARPGFALNSDNAFAIAEICRQLDGLPLALELAAARMQVLTAAELNESLKASLLDLRTTSDQYHSLEAVFDWSLRMLPPDTAAFFSSLSVFRGGWTARAAVEVGGVETMSTALAYLHYLLTCSLIRVTERPDGMRFTLLEPIRQLVESRYGADLAQSLDRHRAYFFQFTRRVNAEFGTEKENSLTREMEPETANILAALDRETSNQERLFAAVDFHEFALHRACNRKVRALLSSTSAQGEEVRLPTLARAWNAIGSLDQVAYDLQNATHAYRRAAELFIAAGEEHGAMAARYNLAVLAMEQDSTFDSQQTFITTLEFFRKAGGRVSCATILQNLAIQARRLGRLTEAEQYISESLIICQEIGEIGALTPARLVLAEIQNDLARHREAEETLLQCLELEFELTKDAHLPGIFINLAASLCGRYDWNTAAYFLGAVDACRREDSPIDRETAIRYENLYAKCREELTDALFQGELRKGKAADQASLRDTLLSLQDHKPQP